MYINGVGILLPNIKSMEEFDELLMRQEELDDWCIEEPIKIQGKLKNRRIDKFIKMAIYCCQNALKTRKADLDAYDIGTVFNSIYGPEDSVVSFYKEVVDEEYEYCSPILFSNTVFNSALGNVCMNLNLKGYSDALMCGRYIEHALRLLKMKKVKACLACGIENICAEKREILKSEGMNLTEGAVALYLEEHKSTGTLAEIIDCESFYLNYTDKNKKYLFYVIDKFLKKNRITINEIDIFINCSYFEEMIDFIDNSTETIVVDDKLGDTMGASLGVSIVAGLRMLKLRQKLWALGIDYGHDGNITCYLLRNELEDKDVIQGV